jgi:hypothetical protein
MVSTGIKPVLITECRANTGMKPVEARALLDVVPISIMGGETHMQQMGIGKHD